MIKGKRRTSFPVWVGVDFANQKSVFVQQQSRWWLQLVWQGLPAAAHPLHWPGGVGITQAVPELWERLPQLFLVAMGTQRKKQESVMINTYVSCLISNVKINTLSLFILSSVLSFLHKERHRTRCPKQNKKKKITRYEFQKQNILFHNALMSNVLPVICVMVKLLVHKTFTQNHISTGKPERTRLSSKLWLCVSLFLCSSQKPSLLFHQKAPQQRRDTIYLTLR